MKTTIIGLLALTPFAGAAITVSSYSHSPNPAASYNDSGTQELTDGVAVVPTWGTGITITTAQIGPFVGWQGTDAATTFTFDSIQTVGQVTVWASDSDGVAGVRLPSTITLSDPNSSFSQTFMVNNPGGNGVMRPITLDGFSVQTDQMEVSFTRATTGSWTMLTEVEFNSVPEPSTAGLLAVASALLLRKKRR
ncbi:MAG: PEP-CTERM sorting domain-containing protein [Roseibacillus sp.]